MQAKLEFNDFIKSTTVRIIFALFAGLTIWRIVIAYTPAPNGDFNPVSFAWGASYQIIAIWGALWGFKMAKSWGGFRSLLGKVILSFSFGLILQAVGQSVYSYYVYTTGSAAYPSLGDIGFFGSIPFYLYGVILLARLSEVTVSLRSFMRSFLALAFPVVMLGASYYVFLSGYQYDWSNPLTVLLDFGYPLGQALYVAIALLSLILIFTRNVLGGIMRGSILLFLLALVMQYISDFTFLYQASRNIYIPEGLNDFMYMVSYFLMALSLIRLGLAFDKIKNAA